MRLIFAAVCIVTLLLSSSDAFAVASCVSVYLLDRKATIDAREPGKYWTQSEITSDREGADRDIVLAEKTCLAEEAANALIAQRIEREKAAAEAEALRVSKLPGVRIGMSAKTVVEKTNWGKPQEINTTTTKNGTHEQWVYGYRSYLYFENGKLTAIQN
jgi:hypothetical protein